MSSDTGLDEAGFSSAAKAAKKKKRIKATESDADNDLQELEYGPHQPPPVNQLDELPIIKSGPSSFEELLERELAKEQEMKRAPNHPSAPSSGSSAPKASFLKRGENSPKQARLHPDNNRSSDAPDLGRHGHHRGYRKLRLHQATKLSRRRGRRLSHPSLPTA